MCPWRLNLAHFRSYTVSMIDMFRMVAYKLILNLMEKDRFVCKLSVCHQLTMLLIVVFTESFFLKRKRRKTYLFA